MTTASMTRYAPKNKMCPIQQKQYTVHCTVYITNYLHILRQQTSTSTLSATLIFAVFTKFSVLKLKNKQIKLVSFTFLSF